MSALLNVDLGEGEGPAGLDRDLVLMRSADMVNVACGFHAGHPETMRAISAAAAESGARLGAHVSYRDRRGFGRRETGSGPSRIAAESSEQIETLRQIAAREGVAVTHVKPHGALYHRLCDDEEAAAAFTAAVAEAGELAVVTLPGGSLHATAGDAGVAVLREGFADRAYESEGRLLGREHPGALLEPEAAAAQAAAIARGAAFAAADGRPLRIAVDTICVHSDSERALETAEAVRRALDRR